MAKRGRPKKVVNSPAPTVPAVVPEKVDNSLSAAMGFNLNNLPFPLNQQAIGSPTISNATPMFYNLRWYLISNFRQLLNEAYVEIGLIQTVVDVPVDDALKGGITIKSKQLSEDELIELENSIDRDDDLTTIGQAAKWNRLFGGAGILILTDQDPETPLDIELLGPDDKLEFRAVDMWELFWTLQNTDEFDPSLQLHDSEFYNYYGMQVHKSRVMKMKGITPPSFIRPRLRGWGFSVVESLVRSINQYLKATDLAYEVLDEFKVDVYKIKNLVNTLLSPNGATRISERTQLANMQKNYQHALVMDSEDEWDHKQLSFSGLAETMAQIRMQVAADMRMPITKLFGISASGFNSGEDDIEVYNGMVEGQVRNKIKYLIMRVCELKCQTLFGYIPDDLSIEFQPLREMSSEQEENVKSQKFARLIQAAQAGLITPQEFRESANKGQLFDVPIDSDMQLPTGYMDDEISDEGTDPENPKDTDNPAAARADTAKPKAAEKGGAPKGQIKPPSMKAKNTKDFKESDHPRDDDGKFTSGGGGGEDSDEYYHFYSVKPDQIKVSDNIRSQKIKGETFYFVDLVAGRQADLSKAKVPEGYELVKTGDTRKVGEKVYATMKLKKSDDGLSARLKEKHPALSGVEAKEIGTRDDIKAKAQQMRADGVYATIYHVGGPKTGPESEYILGVPESKKNSLQTMPRPYSVMEKATRALSNSALFDRASYEADRGDRWIDPRRLPLFDKGKAKDKGLWDRAEQQSEAVFGTVKKEFVIWWYKKQGGAF